MTDLAGAKRKGATMAAFASRMVPPADNDERARRVVAQRTTAASVSAVDIP